MPSVSSHQALHPTISPRPHYMYYNLALTTIVYTLKINICVTSSYLFACCSIWSISKFKSGLGDRYLQFFMCFAASFIKNFFFPFIPYLFYGTIQIVVLCLMVGHLIKLEFIVELNKFRAHDVFLE
jgi:hypothetical protein